MKKAKVFLADDEQNLRDVVRRFVELAGHEVVLEASSLEEALENIKQAVGKGVNVAVIDGNLGTGQGDGPEIARVLRMAIPEIGIISFSGDLVDWGHFNLRKPREISKLGKTIEKILS